MLRFTCPGCSTQLSAPEEYAGRSSKCTKCWQALQIPTPVASIAAPAPLPMAVAPTQQERGFHCPFCGTTSVPRVQSKTSQTGWILFVVMLIFVITILFCWLPLLFMKEESRVCSHCNMKLS